MALLRASTTSLDIWPRGAGCAGRLNNLVVLRTTPPLTDQCVFASGVQLAALYSREDSGAATGDWAVTSLAVCASLTQLTLQKGEPPASAVGCHATGMTSHNRVFPVAGGRYIYGQAPTSVDVEALAATLKTMDTEGAISHFETALGGARAVPVQTVKEVAALCSDGVSKTANFKKKDSGMGWVRATKPTEQRGPWRDCVARSAGPRSALLYAL